MIGAVLFAESLVVQLFLVVAGLLLTEAGLWRLADPVLPDERKYAALRAEANHLGTLIRQLNTAAVALEGGAFGGSRFAIDELQEQMHRSVDRMVMFAGKTKEQVQSSVAGSDAASPGSRGADATGTGAVS